MLRDRRHHSRIPVPDKQGVAMLRAGRRKFTTRLVDVSAFGYAVVCPPELNPRRGDLLALGTSAGWVEAEVVRIHDDEQGTVLGLARVREIDPNSSCLDAIGGRAAALFAVIALIAGAIFGAGMVADSKHPLKRIQAEFNRFISLSR
jgi:hypothetical protein